MGDEHITARMGVDRSAFDRGLAGALSGADKGIRSWLRGLSPIGKMLGFTVGAVAIRQAFVGMLTLAKDTNEARNEIERLRAAGDDAAITMDMLNRASQLDSATLARISAFATEWEKFASNFKSAMAQTTMGAISNVGNIRDSLPQLVLGDEAFRKNMDELERGKMLDAQLAAVRNERERKQMAVAAEVLKIETKLTDLKLRAADVMISDEDKLISLNRVKAALADRMSRGARDDAEMKRWEVEQAETQLEINKTSKKINDDLTRETEKRRAEEERIATAKDRELDAAQKELATLQKSQGKAAEALADRSASSLEEMANATPWTRQGMWNKRAAQEVVNAENFAQRARFEGRGDLEKKAMAYADRIREQLSPLSEDDRRQSRLLDAISWEMMTVRLMLENGTAKFQAANSR